MTINESERQLIIDALSCYKRHCTDNILSARLPKTVTKWRERQRRAIDLKLDLIIEGNKS